MTNSGHEPTGWAQGWSGHEREQLVRLSGLSLPEKIRWLEEAHHLVLHLSAAAPALAERTPHDQPTTKQR